MIPFTSEKELQVASTEFASKMQQMQYDALVEMIGERNEKVGKINAAKGDRDAVFEAVANGNSDEKIVDLRVRLAEIQEEFDAIVNAAVEVTLGEATENADGLLDEVKEIDSTVKSGLSYYKKLYGDDAAAELPKVVRLKGAGGGGGGGKRIRGYNVVVTIDEGESEEFENFASAAKHLGADTATLQQQFFAKAGVEQLKDAPDEVTFSMSWVEVAEDESESNHSALVKAYRTGPSGVPASSDEDAEDEDEDEATDSDETDLEDL